MKTIFTITMVQDRIATGRDRHGRTIAYLARDNWRAGRVEILYVKPSKRVLFRDQRPQYSVLGSITLIHPWIMWGSPEDIREDFNRAIQTYLIDQHLVDRYPCGNFQPTRKLLSLVFSGHRSAGVGNSLGDRVEPPNRTVPQGEPTSEKHADDLQNQ
jgi:hypothetical protein